MKSLERLGLKLGAEISLVELLSENFNPHLYSLSKSQVEKVCALRDIVSTYITSKQDPTGSKISDPKSAVSLIGDKLRYIEHEEVWVAYLNKNNEVIALEMLCSGTLTQVNIGHRDIIAKALSKDATGIILYHNHPSGNPMPGLEDINATSTLTKACKLIGIEMVDHLVISAGSYYSFAEERTEKFNKKS